MQQTQTLPRVSGTLAEMLAAFQAQRDNEVSALAEMLPQYVQDHNDSAAYRQIDRQVNALARGLDKMIARLAKWQVEAKKIEASVECFHGE